MSPYMTYLPRQNRAALQAESLLAGYSFTVDESHAAENNINADLQRIRDWGSHQMICKLLSFKLSFLGKDLLPTDYVKDLGVIFDPTLSFDCHITALAVSCISKLAQINRAKHAFNPNLLVTI